MRLEELKNEWSEIPDHIHNMIQEEVEKQIGKSNIVPMRRKNRFKWNMSRIAVAAVTCIVATSTVAYAGTKLYHMYLEKQGTYSVSTSIHINEGEEDLKLPKKIHDISVTSKYIPEGMEWVDEGVKLSYKNTPYQGGISIASVLMEKKDLNEALLDTNVIESEEHIFGTYDGVYLKYDDLKKDKSFNQRIYLLCPENYRVLIIYIGDDVSKADAYKFVENLVIMEKEEMLETANMYTWSDEVNPKIEVGEAATTNGQVPIHQIGDVLSLGYAAGEDKDGNYISTDKITVCVDEVQIADNLQLLDKEGIPEDWKTAVDENGNLVQNHLSYVKKGNGVESLGTVVKEENVNQKLVFTTVTYTNTSDKEIKHMLYLGSLMTLSKQEDGTYTVYMAEETAGDGYDYYTGDSVARMAEMKYFSVREDDGDRKNYIASIKPGESVQVHMAWIVNEKDIENMYLNLDGTGTAYELNDDVLRSGVVYIGK